jgi:DNA-binding beta-propeller fold protein YncE/predicted Ser/Thr protein kinase
VQSQTGTVAGRVGPLRPGDPRRVGSYKLTGLLGEGGMGQVFLGRSRSGRPVAVKLIRPEYARQPAFRERFAREVAAARMVGGFHAVPVVDADPRAERPWMATAYIAAPSLQDRVDTAGPLGTAKVARAGAHLAEGLAAIHACGLVHRDLKPGNVLLAADGARIIDFGIARAVGAVTLTTAGTMLGTCLYMSPEQMRDGDITAASDIFSLGSVLAFAATGAPPFRAATLPGIVRDIMDGDPDLADVPDPLVPLIAACLAKDPAARPGLDDIISRCTALGPRPARARPPAARPAARTGAAPRRPPVPPGAPSASGTGPGPVRRRVLLAGGAAAIAAAGAVFPLEFLASGSTGRLAGSRGPQAPASPRSSPAIRRVLIPGPSGPVGPGLSSAVLSPDGAMVAFTTPGPGGAKVWLLDAAGMRVAASIALGHGSSAVVFSPDGRALAAVGFGGEPEAVRLWRLQAIGSTALNLTASAAVPRAPRAFGAAAFSPDGGHLAVSADTGLSLLDAATLRTVRSVPAPPGASGGPVYRPDGQVLAVGGAPGYLSRGSLGGAVCLLDAASLNMIAPRSVPDLDAYSLTFSPDGRTLALVGHGQAGGVVRLLDASSLRTVATAALPGGAGVTAAAAAGFTPDGTVLAGYSVASDAVAWLMQAATLKIIASARIGPASDITGLAVDLSADGGTLMAACTSQRARPGRIQLYQIQPG